MESRDEKVKVQVQPMRLWSANSGQLPIGTASDLGVEKPLIAERVPFGILWWKLKMDGKGG